MKMSKSKIVLIVAGILLIGAAASEPTEEPVVVEQTVEATPEITPFVNNIKTTQKPKATKIPSVSDKEAGKEAETLFYDYCPKKNGAVFKWYFIDYTNPNEFLIYVKIPGAGDKCFGSGKIVSSVREYLTEIYNAARETLRKCGDTNDSINIEITLENDQEDGEWDYICEYVNDILDYSFVD